MHQFCGGRIECVINSLVFLVKVMILLVWCIFFAGFDKVSKACKGFKSGMRDARSCHKCIAEACAHRNGRGADFFR